ncbi:DHH family phosphoesterase [Heyndrickxia ginsengihumi]|uniref:Bifunctional oligoribonuclease/PAP phosphatase NrnA n=1 Tax=Heyndrickxia ginsengihumi TaxID=363870 RepID=A0A6M0PAS9_9BACI|nr:bifunctional oligoribonuclease/PAP phosphatase NrnA [Heyndrickxia ginsengihumi]MBE6182671.1 bifunctional oligoribonuclease/PAP phosphatase NrnA [Bacillus sp. (in: firmicutes)]MCM3022016.1 bifunctional oligoribonuclease/PAP phosphatase NrnA [Heyndrickxia ginsengihumi]NEY21099.1 bifunctional oligoribonuclease/PAP phosphatase NrnA [Heyndrickxia ginsengihumi]
MKEKILQTIQQYNTIIVHRHVRPDPDAYGSQGGLVEVLKASFPDKHIYAVGKPEPSLEFLHTLDQIPDETYDKALVIVCDTANQERVSDQRYKNGDMLIKIDHHPNVDAYGDIQWVDTNASSVSEMIYEFYLFGKEKGLKMNDKAARLIYAGIVGDTGRFLYPSTTEKTFDYAGELIHYSFDRTELYNKLYEVDSKVIRLQGSIYQNFELLENGAAIVKISKEMLQEYGVQATQASQLVSTLGDIKGLKAWCFFVEEDDQIRVRLRSKGPVINTLAQKYNGGGHPLAAGASIYSWNEVESIKEDLITLCKE